MSICNQNPQLRSVWLSRRRFPRRRARRLRAAPGARGKRCAPHAERAGERGAGGAASLPVGMAALASAPCAVPASAAAAGESSGGGAGAPGGGGFGPSASPSPSPLPLQSPSSWGSAGAAAAFEASLESEYERARRERSHVWRTRDIGGGERCEVDASGVFVWDSALLLARHLTERARSAVAGLRVCELGCGSALPSFAAALAGAAEVVATDCDDKAVAAVRGAIAEGTVRRPLDASRLAAMRATELDWFACETDAAVARAAGTAGCDVVLAADCNYCTSRARRQSVACRRSHACGWAHSDAAPPPASSQSPPPSTLSRPLSMPACGRAAWCSSRAERAASRSMTSCGRLRRAATCTPRPWRCCSHTRASTARRRLRTRSGSSGGQHERALSQTDL